MKNLYAITFYSFWNYTDSTGWFVKFVLLTEDEVLDLVLNKYHSVREEFNKEKNMYEEFKTYEDVKEFFRKHFRIKKWWWVNNGRIITIENSQEYFVDYEGIYYQRKTFYWYKLLKENVSEEERKIIENMFKHIM